MSFGGENMSATSGESNSINSAMVEHDREHGLQWQDHIDVKE
jgi:hypothetical protein